MADTTNFGWTKPIVSGSSGAWGTILNTLFDDQDTDVEAVKTTADAALPKAGGTMTGSTFEYHNRYVANALGNKGADFTIDLSTGNVFSFTVTSALTVSFSNPPAAGAMPIVLIITSGGIGVTWPGTVKWPSGTAPALSSSGKVDIVTLLYNQADLKYYGGVGLLDLR